MIRINLLPVRGKKGQDIVKQFVAAYILTIVLTLSVIGYLWYGMSREIRALESQSARIQQEVTQYAKFDALLQDLKKKKENVDKKHEVIDGLRKDRDVIARMLALLSVQIPPEKIWFEKFAQTANSITLDGVALSNEAIVEFMRNLESSPYIAKGSVSLTHSKQMTLSNMKLREFQVTYRFFPFSEVQKTLKMQAS